MTELLFHDGRVSLRAGDCFAVLDTLAESSVDAVVSDPPYGLDFMGKGWDAADNVAFRPALWAKVLRVLKPGGHVVAFSGTRTYHRMVCAMEDAGFEIRDQLGWVYSQGFPKSHNITRALDGTRCRCEAVAGRAPAERDLRSMLSADVSKAEPAGRGRGEVLLAGLPEQGTHRAMPGTKPAQGGQGRQELGMEGRCDVSEEAGELRLSALCPLPAGSDRDGARGWLCDGSPAGDGALGAAGFEPHGSSSPSGPRPSQQRADEPRIMAGQPKPQAGRAWPVCDRCGKPLVPDGLGTALKPAWEPICLARKPLAGTVAENVLAHGVGAINVDGCRVGTDGGTKGCDAGPSNGILGDGLNGSFGKPVAGLGRWPANLVHDGSPEVLACFPETTSGGGIRNSDARQMDGWGMSGGDARSFEANEGSAARFFYCAKADGDDRLKSKHPTVKPVDLMRWLVRLVTPKGGTVLDPFAGTGTTGQAALIEGARAVLIEREAEYRADIARRMDLVFAGASERLAALAEPAALDALPLFAAEPGDAPAGPRRQTGSLGKVYAGGLF